MALHVILITKFVFVLTVYAALVEEAVPIVKVMVVVLRVLARV